MKQILFSFYLLNYYNPWLKTYKQNDKSSFKTIVMIFIIDQHAYYSHSYNIMNLIKFLFNL